MILGATALPTGLEQLAGTDLAFSLALHKIAAESGDFDVSVRLVDRRGVEVAGWEGWPLPAYPTSAWPDQGLTLVPVSLFIPPTAPAGQFKLVASLIGHNDAMHFPAQRLADIDVRVRPAVMTRPQPQVLLPSPVQFGTHARLYGYDYRADGDAIQLALYWGVRQTLLPPHSIFVHVVAPSGEIVAQQDGPPVTADGPAPTGSWRASEFIVSRHTIMLPATLAAAGTPPDWRLRIGLYEPASEVRLPASVDGLTTGDSVEISVAP